MKNPIIELSKALINCPSISPKDHGCQDIISKRLQALGFDITLLPFGEGEQKVSNIWAQRCHNPDAPLVVFAGHTDVVPPGEGWQSPPFAATLRDTPDGEPALYGRGAVDMKIALAAMIVATEDYLKSTNSPLNLGFLITSDEEADAINGTDKVCDYLAEHNIRPNYCLIGEPSSEQRLGDIVKNGRRGSLSARLVIEGVQGHIAYPHKADNPIHRALALLSQLVETVWDNGNNDFPPTSFQISNIHAGTGATNVIPGELIIDCNFRFSTESSAESLQQSFSALLDKASLSYRLTWKLSAKPFLSQEGHLISATTAAIKKITNIDTQCSTGGGTSDGRFITRICPEVLEFGLKNALAHKVDEHAPIAEIMQLKDIYATTLTLLESRTKQS